jgi:hypothetical protein
MEKSSTACMAGTGTQERIIHQTRGIEGHDINSPPATTPQAWEILGREVKKICTITRMRFPLSTKQTSRLLAISSVFRQRDGFLLYCPVPAMLLDITRLTPARSGRANNEMTKSFTSDLGTQPYQRKTVNNINKTKGAE